jgi:hypothetical protein
MTHTCCPSCRLRFSPAAAAYLVACPNCGDPPQPIASLKDVLGFRLFEPEEAIPALPQALAISLSLPGRSPSDGTGR